MLWRCPNRLKAHVPGASLAPREKMLLHRSCSFNFVEIVLTYDASLCTLFIDPCFK
jgi:hypothetical protein